MPAPLGTGVGELAGDIHHEERGFERGGAPFSSDFSDVACRDAAAQGCVHGRVESADRVPLAGYFPT